MAYFLKRTKLNGRTYLSIVESFYSPEKKGTAHRTYKSLKSVETWIARGVADPVSHFQKEVDELNESRRMEAAPEISETPPKRYVGYFLAKAVLEKLKVKKYVDYFKLTTNYDFDLYEALSALIYSRLVKACSKRRTYSEVIPCLYEKYDFSYDQLLEAVRFFGNDYEKIVELFAHQLDAVYGINAEKTYFDCTNFYFEIDREDDFRRKGPSKESRKDPIIGLGLLLDANLLPIGMRMYPGNESEKPQLRSVVDGLKDQNNISGRTVHVADKGLNCAKNIFEARRAGDGYLFSKSVKQLPETEEAWVLLPGGYKEARDGKGNVLYEYKECVDRFPYDYVDESGKKHKIKLTEKRVATYNPSLARKKIYEIDRMAEKARRLAHSQAKKAMYGESSRYVDFVDEKGGKAIAEVNAGKIERDKRLAGYNLLVTSETKTSASDIYETYHNLWRIEESFKIMKSDLDARPAYMKTEETIKGHFLICYLSVLVERIVQFVELEDKYPSEAIFKFFKEFMVVEADGKYVNISARNDFIVGLKEKTALPLTNYILTETQLKKVMNYKL